MIILSKNIDYQQLLVSIIAGLVVGSVQMFLSISIATYIFAGSLSAKITTGVGIAILSGLIINIVMSLTSSIRYAAFHIQSPPSVIIAILVASTVKELPQNFTPDQVLIAVLGSIGFTTFFTGILCLGLGFFKLGNLTRFLPYPVIGGFLAGTGWLLTRGGIQIMVKNPLKLATLSQLFEFPVIWQWLSALFIGTILVFLSRRYKHWLILPCSLLSFNLLFYLIFWLADISVEKAQSMGWLIEVSVENNHWHFFNVFDLKNLNFSAFMALLLKNYQFTLSIASLSVITLLLNVSGLELATQEEFDLNKELQSAGFANLCASFFCGLTGYHSFGTSLLSYKIGSRSRWFALFTLVVSFSGLFFGPLLVTLFPKPVLGGLLIFLGLSLIVEWVYDAYFKLRLREYFNLLLILLIIALVGFLQGFLIGLIIAITIFLIDYSKLPITKNILTGKDYPSSLHRPWRDRQILNSDQATIDILELEGFIFFGSADQLSQEIKQLIYNNINSVLRFIILDFRFVKGVDSSAIKTFTKIKELAKKSDVHLLVSHLSEQLNLGKSYQKNQYFEKVFIDIDHAVEWCEEQILNELSNPKLSDLNQSLEKSTLLQDNIVQVNSYVEFLDSLDQEEAKDFSCYLTSFEFNAGDYIFKSEELPEAIYFVISGEITVWLERQDQKRKRVRKFLAGTILGELSVYGNIPHSTSAIADQPTYLYAMSQEQFKKMELESPHLASKFHRFIVELLAERLHHSYRILKQLL